MVFRSGRGGAAETALPVDKCEGAFRSREGSDGLFEGPAWQAGKRHCGITQTFHWSLRWQFHTLSATKLGAKNNNVNICHMPIGYIWGCQKEGLVDCYRGSWKNLLLVRKANRYTG